MPGQLDGPRPRMGSESISRGSRPPSSIATVCRTSTSRVHCKMKASICMCQAVYNSRLMDHSGKLGQTLGYETRDRSNSLPASPSRLTIPMPFQADSHLRLSSFSASCSLCLVSSLLSTLKMISMPTSSPSGSPFMLAGLASKTRITRGMEKPVWKLTVRAGNPNEGVQSYLWDQLT